MRIAGELTAAAAAATEPKKRLLDRLFMRKPPVRAKGDDENIKLLGFMQLPIEWDAAARQVLALDQ